MVISKESPLYSGKHLKDLITFSFLGFSWFLLYFSLNSLSSFRCLLYPSHLSPGVVSPLSYQHRAFLNFRHTQASAVSSSWPTLPLHAPSCAYEITSESPGYAVETVHQAHLAIIPSCPVNKVSYCFFSASVVHWVPILATVRRHCNCFVCMAGCWSVTCWRTCVRLLSYLE